MKKFCFITLLVASVCVLIYFIGLPFAREYINARSIHTDVLPSAQDAQSLTVWQKRQENVYIPRPMPDLQTAFQAIGYPPFLPLADGSGAQPQRNGEKSFHENGNMLYLYYDDNFYTNGGTLNIAVSQKQYNAASMPAQVDTFVRFIEIITGNVVNSEDRKALLRMTSDTINMGLEWKPSTIKINGAEWTFKLDPTVFSMSLSY